MSSESHELDSSSDLALGDDLTNLLNSTNATASGDSTQPLLTGTVVAIQANYYQVKLDSIAPISVDQSVDQVAVDVDRSANTPPCSSPSHPSTLLCTRRARLKKLGQRVMVGDRVTIQEPDWAGGRGAIADVFPRRSELDRPPVANADQILLVFALAEPTLDPYQLSRFLVKAESTGLDVTLCLSKRDLITLQTERAWRDRLQQWGYPPILISVRKALGMVEVERRLQGKTTIASGPSGVGKSSLINRLIPQAALRVAAVSGKLGRGRHTTRHVELFELPGGGLLADTPGFNQPDLACTPQELVFFFPEARQRLENAQCQFTDCLHRDEPNCAVRGDWERYNHYLDFLQEAIVYQQSLDRSRDEEANLKQKTKRQGRQQLEPKLETKKYRRVSRRAQQQELQGLHDEAMHEEQDEQP